MKNASDFAISALVLCLSLIFAWPVRALESGIVASRHSTASLITSTDAIAPGQPFYAALHLRLAPGWHTYWRNPGDAGVAPDLTFEQRPGLTAESLQWPPPKRVAEGSLMTYAYQDDVVLPLELHSATAPLALKAHANWLVCRDICVPEEADFTIDVPAGTPKPSAQAASIDAARQQSPAAIIASHISPNGVLSIATKLVPADAKTVDFFPTNDGVVNTAGPSSAVLRGAELQLPLSLGTTWKPNTALSGVLVVTTASGGHSTFAVETTPGPPVAQSQPVAALLVLAVAGGLLLNLMPCVFPILAMKAFALARMSGSGGGQVRAEAASYVAGVIVAFTALGAGFVLLRNTGQAVGWGFQFQSPTFVTLMAWLLFATGLNMSGVFSLGEGLTGAGQGLASRGGHAGSFFTGLLAVLVATPCTASFMTAAIAGAVTEPTPIALLIFAMLGVGLALPYALVAAVPALARLLPRPGRWMAVLRQALAFPMYGATAWLVWVASQQVGAAGVMTAAAGLVTLGFAGWALGLAQTSGGWGRRVGQGASLAGIIICGALLAGETDFAAPEQSEPFTAARLAELRGEGRPVFVNMTAAWCLSCLVNERIALSPSSVRDAFARGHVAYLKGDWTKQDPAITAFLREQGRDGVPLYVFYAPGHSPDVLPQLLSERTVLDEVRNAGS